MEVHHISDEKLTLDTIKQILDSNCKLELSDSAKEKIKTCRQYLDDKLANSDEPIYGINTGFGSLCNTQIDKADLEQLQENLVVSHACGVGEEVPINIVRLMLLFKIHALSLGYSGVRLELVEQLVAFYNEEIYPIVYQQGSLGASGDLSPLAHLSLPLLGKGEVKHKGVKMPANLIMDHKQITPIALKAKEGIALLNGTQFMSAYAVHCLLSAQKDIGWADTIAAISIDAFNCKLDPYYEGIHKVRPHSGQIETAKKITELLEGSEIAARKKEQVQDPYSFRCIPQVHGATKDALKHIVEVIETEVNSVTDNPIIFPKEDKIVSGGNFHGQPLALALDHLAIIMSEIASISERRTYKLLSGERGLPEFLVANPGLNSGLMIPQYTAASIVSQNKQLCTPSSVDTIDSSNGQEDHVSMGANAATKAYKVVGNVTKVLAIEMLTSTQALAFRENVKTSEPLQAIIENYRKEVPFIKKDRELYEDIHKSIEFLGDRI